MEMKVNSKLIKSERDKRAWSQEHLARAAGLGVRTIQRIENTGSASLESVKALASVLELQIPQLQVNSKQSATAKEIINSKNVSLATLIVTLLLLVGLITIRPSLAEAVKLDYTVFIEDQDDEENAVGAVAMGNELISEGQSMTVLLDQYMLEITPSIQEGGDEIMLTVKVFENVDGEYSLRAEPKVITADNQVATIRSNSSTGHLLSVFLTPSIQ